MNPLEIILAMIQADLNIYNPPPATLTYLNQLVDVAQAEIRKEGILLDLQKLDDCQTVGMYAAYLYRRRAAPNNEMPRMLRWRLNNALFSQKMKG